MAWLSGWDKRIKLTIDHTKVDAVLTWFPVTVFLSSTHGDCVFDELTANANRFKIAFTKSDGETELYGEIEKWDDANEIAIIHISRDGWAVSNTVDTDFYMYYDVGHADNTTYIGDIDSTPGAAVWDSDFKLVCHMVDATTSTVKDSTSNDNDGTKKAANNPEELDGNIGKRQFFDGNNYITISAAASLKFGTGDFSVECVILQASALQDAYGLMSYGDRHDSKGWSAYIGAAGVAKFIIDDGTTQVVLEDAVDHTDDNYHAYAVCMDRDGNGVIYIDGGVVETESIAGANLTMDTVDHDDIELGRLWYQNSYLNYLTGSEDEIRISACNRSAAWIKATYNTLWDILLTYGSEEALTYYTLSAGSGTFTLTGTAASLLKNFVLSADSGSYAVVGSDVALLKGFLLSVGSGSFTIIGQTASLYHTPVIIQTDWKAYKGAGPWPFIPQPDKPHYNEGNLISDADNPVWEMDFPGPLVTPVHNPWCGYWPKGEGEEEEEDFPEVDIFVLTWSGTHTIYGAHFDGESLKYIGKYSPAEDINGLILYEDDLLTVAGAGVTAELRRISTEAVAEEFSLLNTYNTFNSYDVRDPFYGKLVNGALGKFYYTDSSSVAVSVHELSRNKRGFRSIVITGTDGNLYVLKGDIYTWASIFHPITGSHWHLAFSLIGDNICDSPITSWGEGTPTTSCGSGMDICYHNGYLYTVDFANISRLTKIDPTTLEAITYNACSVCYFTRLTAHGDKIYAMGGATTTTVYIFNASDLSLVHSVVLPFGRAVDGDMEIVGNHLIVSTGTYYPSPGTLYKLSLDDLSIIAYTNLADEGQRLAIISDVYVAVGWNSGLSVVNVETMSLVDRSLVLTTPVFGYHAQAVVVKHL